MVSANVHASRSTPRFHVHQIVYDPAGILAPVDQVAKVDQCHFCSAKFGLSMEPDHVVQLFQAIELAMDVADGAIDRLGHGSHLMPDCAQKRAVPPKRRRARNASVPVAALLDGVGRRSWGSCPIDTTAHGLIR